ncbi:hypothetical protein F5Y18DRAFT_22749 [Xylariaceae sp. FL1019]|nr:hypothetical protein F5Y18DRAFT_22749 [Xylariaceae sp. FL1019]
MCTMPPSRRSDRLRADIQAAREATHPNIEKIDKGDVQDEFVIIFTHPCLAGGKLEIRVMPQEPTGYPEDNSYLIYTNEDVPAAVSSVLGDTLVSMSNLSVKDMIKKLTQQLCTKLDPVTGNSDDDDTLITDSDNMDEDQSDYPDDTDEELDPDWSRDIDEPVKPRLGNRVRPTATRSIDEDSLKVVRRDFHAVIIGGFRVGKILGIDRVTDYSIASMSIKVSKLGFPEEASKALDLSPSEYIVLLMKYEGRFPTFKDIIEKAESEIRVEFRLKKCSRYRPTMEEAVAAFRSNKRFSDGTRKPEAQDQEQTSESHNLVSFAVGESIELLLNGDFIGLTKLRYNRGISWDEAKQLLRTLPTIVTPFPSASTRDLSSRSTVNKGTVPNKRSKKQERSGVKLPPCLASDHLSSGSEPLSFPLIATQCAFRYLVKCTEYCMICHEKLTEELEALKPYVCSKPLCLFQYMNLGLGPGIDHEIISQPSVVDLLVSFCYVSVRGSQIQIREFPLGLGLQVPQVTSHPVPLSLPPPSQPPKPKPEPKPKPKPAGHVPMGVLVNPITVEISWKDNTVTLLKTNDADDAISSNDQNLKVGQWVLIFTPSYLAPTRDAIQGKSETPFCICHHARIIFRERSFLEVEVASRHTSVGTEPPEDWSAITWTSFFSPGKLVLYDKAFDELRTAENRALAMQILLLSIPPVEEMRTYLMGGPNRKLATWSRISPAAMKLLRWIVASNRSVIVPVDTNTGEDKTSKDNQATRLQEKIGGVGDDWIQFRFAQGSPEREVLFQKALEGVNKPVRTLLGWHGSSLGNWHSIIRQGLNFDKTVNGRAFGNGVYFSQLFDYSMGYTGHAVQIHVQGQHPQGQHFWPQSSLKITAALSLNELINLPEEFVESRSCFVVNNLDWIQCRYLFVRLLDTGAYEPAFQPIAAMPQAVLHGLPQPTGEFIQDPKYVARGPASRPLTIPNIAFASTRRPGRPQTSRRLLPLYENGMEIVDDTDDNEEEDMEFLHTYPTKEMIAAKPTCTASMNQESLTDFRPGTLDISTLPQLALPSYATNQAQKTIQQELKKLQKVQETTPLHILGWYMDFEQINNMFQWIVELHSFDPSLPLAIDMKKAGCTSIVLEIRFLRGFPYTPPFIRVIRPRFMPFFQGGGGHVTGGGAMCMELLTNTGWSPVSSMESVLLQVRLAICNPEPRPARLEQSRSGLEAQDYGVGEAIEAFMRAAAAHGWQVPQELGEISRA